MDIVRSIDTLIPPPSGSCVTIGNFDGVHCGHQKLVLRVREKARARGLKSVVITFDPHPLRVLLDRKTPPFITLTDQKLELLAQLGVDLTLCLPFTKAMAALEPEDFVRTYLVQGLNVKELIIGYDYAFGKGRKGNFQALAELGAKYGFHTEQVDSLMIEGAIVSSTRIRDMVQAGMVWEVRPLLGRFYRVVGAVIRGKDRGGRLLGFPTANLKLVDELFPKPGVYAVWAEISGQTLAGVANIGFNPTFENNALSVEVHLLDFKADLYGQQLKVHFVQRLRDERKFSGIDELVVQIKKDILLGQAILHSPEAQLT